MTAWQMHRSMRWLVDLSGPNTVVRQQDGALLPLDLGLDKRKRSTTIAATVVPLAKLDTINQINT
jgi:hypothetical protein